MTWSRSTLLVLGLYALFQLFLYAFIFTGSITRPTTGDGPAVCANVVFGFTSGAKDVSSIVARVQDYDTTPYIVPPYSRPVQNGEAVFTNLALLREATRDGWIYFAGDASLKQSYYEYTSILSRNGVLAPISAKLAKKRHAARHDKDEVRIGSSRVTFAYAPKYTDVTRGLEKVWKEVVPPSLIVLSAGTWDANNRTDVSLATLEAEQDALIEALRVRLAARKATGKRVPVVLVLSTPSFAAQSTDSTVSHGTMSVVERNAELGKRLKEKVKTLAITMASDSSSSTAAATPESLIHSPVAYGDVTGLALPLKGQLPIYEDDGVRLMINPTVHAASLAAFTSCALGQPSWEIRAFTPGQVALALLWATALALWVYGQMKSKLGLFASSRGSYHRISSSDSGEIELGPTSNGSITANGSVHPSKSSPPPPSEDARSPVAVQVINSPLPYFSSPAWNNVLAALVQFGCILLFMFMMDGNQRLSWPIIGDKQYIRDTFLFLLVVIGLLAWRSMSVTTDAVDSLLNREQTEEWKGWMQILFVLYHFFAAKEMYNLIRVFIAAYVWMTGYGNFFFFYKTNDYSFARLMKLLFRLNFFVAFVCVALNREFMQYYVCALHTFYFLCVYVTMGVMWQWNKNDKLLLIKFVALFLVLFLLFDVPSLGIFNFIFSPFSIFYWKDSMWEWWFRSKLDHYATLFGMICAWNVKRIEQFLNRIESPSTLGNASPTKSRNYAPFLAAFVLIAIGLVWMVYCLWLPKGEYNAQHPYTSMIPILLYILLRNLTPYLRRHVLHLFTWFGKITLETYILQFHIWLSDDAATIITYFPNYPMFNWMLSTAIYVALSMLMFQITNVLSDALIPRSCSAADLLVKMFILIGGWYTIHNVVQFALSATVL